MLLPKRRLKSNLSFQIPVNSGIPKVDELRVIEGHDSVATYIKGFLGQIQLTL